MDTKLLEPDRQKLDGIVHQMTQNGESDHAIQFVVSDFKQKYGKQTLEQSIGQTAKDYGTVTKEAFNSGINQTKEGYNQSKNANNPFDFVAGGAKTAMGAINTVLSPLAVLSKPLEKGFNKSIDEISNHPTVQKFAQTPTGQNVAKGAEFVGNLAGIAGTVAGAKNPLETANVLKDTATNTISKTGDALENVRAKLTPDATKSFNSNINKAFPILKKDVGNMSAKAKNIYTAFSDIIANKESLGLTDSAGNPRNPTNFVETVDAQNMRLPKIYESYTSKLSSIDKTKFDTNIQTSLQDQIKNIDTKLVKENSIDNRQALMKIKGELSSLRDTSPEGIQNYIQTINQKVKPLAPGGSLTSEQIQYANLGGDLRKLLDDSIEKIDGKGYQTERNIYAAHKQIQSQLLMAAKKEMNAVPGFTEKLISAGFTIEGINFLLTHNPQALVIGAGLKGFQKLSAFLKSPQRGLNNIFNKIEEGYNLPKVTSPETIK